MKRHDPFWEENQLPDSIRSAVANVLHHSRKAGEFPLYSSVEDLIHAAVSNKGSEFAVVSRSGRLSCGSFVGKKELSQIRIFLPGSVSAISYCPDDEHLLVGHSSGKVEKVILDGGTTIATNEESGSKPLALEMTGNGEWVVLRENRTLSLHAEDGHLIARVVLPERDGIPQLHASNQGDRFVVGFLASSGASILSVTRVGETLKVSGELEGGGILSSMGGSSDGNLIALGKENGMLSFLNSSGGGFGKEFVAHDSAIDGLVFSRKGDLIAAASRDFKIRVWTRGGTPHTPLLSGHMTPVKKMIFSSNGRWLVSIDQTVALVWDLLGLEISAPFTLPATSDALQFSPDGESLFVGMTNGAVGKLTWNNRKFEVSDYHLGEGISELTVDSTGNLILGASSESETIFALNSSDLSLVTEVKDTQHGGVLALRAMPDMPMAAAYTDMGKIIYFPLDKPPWV